MCLGTGIALVSGCSGPSFAAFLSLQLRKPRGLSQPVVLIRGRDAELLMGVVNKNREAHVKIEIKEPPAWVRDTPFPLPSVSSLPNCCAKDAELSSPGTEVTSLPRSCPTAKCFQLI